MYLSKLELNRSRQSHMWLARPYRIHQRLKMAAGDDARLLYRIEMPRQGGPRLPYILAQTVNEPDWDAAFGEFPVLNDKQCMRVERKLFDGQMLVFRLRANPTARKRLDDGSKKRVGLVKEEEQRAWLRRKAEVGGFELVHVDVRQDQPIMDGYEKKGKSHRIKLVMAQFDGVLKVTDAEAFEKTLAAGIGSGKGFGCGLLSIANVRG